MTRTAFALLLLSGCSSVDVVLWSTEGGTVNIDSEVDALSDCSVRNEEGALDTDCDTASDAYSCEDDADGVQVCSRLVQTISTDDLELGSTVAVLSADADEGYVFTGWDGCEGQDLVLSDDGQLCSIVNSGATTSYRLALAQSEADANVVARFAEE
jgi:hypothetical protein